MGRHHQSQRCWIRNIGHVREDPTEQSLEQDVSKTKDTVWVISKSVGLHCLTMILRTYLKYRYSLRDVCWWQTPRSEDKIERALLSVQRDENSIDLPQSTVQLRNQFLQAGHTTRPSLSLSVLEAWWNIVGVRRNSLTDKPCSQIHPDYPWVMFGILESDSINIFEMKDVWGLTAWIWCCTRCDAKVLHFVNIIFNLPLQ